MSPWATLLLALKAIRRNRVRAALTMLGVIIGVASVIAMIGLGSGAREAIDQQVQSQGTNVVYVTSGSVGARGGGVRGGAGSITTLTLDDAGALSELPGVMHASPVVRGRVQVIAGNMNWNTSIEGADEGYFAVRNWPIVRGEAFSPRDAMTADKVCLLGSTVARQLFGTDDPTGSVIRVKSLPFRVAGVLGPKGQGQWGQDQDDLIVAPYTTVQKKILGITYIQQVLLSATTADQVESVASAATQLLRERHRSPSPEEDDFMVRTVEEMAAARVEMARTMTMLLMSVASVSLLVGGIGIMNIMLVSVTERTREIGLRLAIGARGKDVLRQFLAEAVTLSLMGGALGIALGVGVSQFLTNVLGWPTAIGPESVLVAFAFAFAVGVLFGYWPARRAAGLDPIEALRYE